MKPKDIIAGPQLAGVQSVQCTRPSKGRQIVRSGGLRGGEISNSIVVLGGGGVTSQGIVLVFHLKVTVKK